MANTAAVSISPASTSPVSASAFRRYVRELRAFTGHAIASGGLPLSGVEVASAHLDGRAGRELRASVELDYLRSVGAFFTGESIASRALALVDDRALEGRVVDPACGCGDLLLAAAKRFPMRGTLEQTLREWGERLIGVDTEPEFVVVARERIALLAMIRGARSDGQALDLSALMPGLKVADGRSPELLRRSSAVLLNPPYGQVRAPLQCAFTSGRTTAAALWLHDIVESGPRGVEVVAVLPDVLRSGSRYARWRAAIAAQARVLDVRPEGQFDALTDVDVFLLRLRLSGGSTGGWPADIADGPALGSICAVSTGPVVDRRDPHTGPEVPYLTTRELPAAGDYRVQRTRRFGKRLFKPPFVVVRRTSRPVVGAPRLRPVVILGTEDVAVENHLLVLQPDDGGLAACRSLAHALVEPAVSAWLDRRMRCRHVTVAALREIPLEHLQRKRNVATHP